MIQSRFSYRTYIHITLAVITLIYPFYLFFNRKETFGNHYNLKFIFVSSLMLLSCSWLILGIIKRITKISQHVAKDYSALLYNINLVFETLEYKIVRRDYKLIC